MVDTFEVGKLYSNEEIFSALAVGNAGGVRASIRDVFRQGKKGAILEFLDDLIPNGLVQFKYEFVFVHVPVLLDRASSCPNHRFRARSI